MLCNSASVLVAFNILRRRQNHLVLRTHIDIANGFRSAIIARSGMKWGYHRKIDAVYSGHFRIFEGYNARIDQLKI